jgi:hypothetical protein
MGRFLDRFPKVLYDIEGRRLSTYDTVTDLSFRFSIIKDAIKSVSSYYDYVIRDGETPEILADRVYDDPEGYWVILYANDIYDPQYDWPLDSNAFKRFIIGKYGSTQAAKSNIHHYEKLITRQIGDTSTSQIRRQIVDFNTPVDLVCTLDNIIYYVSPGQNLVQKDPVSNTSNTFEGYATSVTGNTITLTINSGIIANGVDLSGYILVDEQQAKIQANNSSTNYYFGSSVAISSDGNTCAVGAYLSENSSGYDIGSAYIFTRSGSTWTQQALLQASDVLSTDLFGYSIALSSDGNTCAVGVPYEDNSGGTEAGCAYIFTRSGSTWTQQGRLQASDAATSDQFGYSITLSSDGNTCAIGAYADDNSGGIDAGSVYIFTRSGSTWTQQARLQASDAAPSDYFGSSVAISSDGNTCAVGSILDNNSGGSDAGSVYIFTRSGSTWSQQARLQASDAAPSDYFGSSVAISSDGNTCAIGAYADNNSGGSDAGSVYIFTRSGSTWSQQARIQASDAAPNDQFGFSVSLSGDGNMCAIGAYVDDTTGGSDAGSVYIFVRTDTTWVQRSSIQSSDAAPNDQFGYSVALSSDGNNCVVGAILGDTSDGTNAGTAYIFVAATESFGRVIENTHSSLDFYVNLSESPQTNSYVINNKNITETVERTAVSFYDYEYEKNENKRFIKVIKKEYYSQIQNEFKALTKTEPRFIRRLV